MTLKTGEMSAERLALSSQEKNTFDNIFKIVIIFYNITVLIVFLIKHESTRNFS